MKLKSNLKLTQHGIDKIIDGALISSDDFVEFDAIRIKKDGEFLEISLLLDDEVACFVDEVMVLRDGWSVEIKSTISFKVGVKIE
jgi:hypothetical protein